MAFNARQITDIVGPLGGRPRKGKGEKSIIGELIPLKLGDEINQRADLIYHQMDEPVRRKRRRKYLLFYCVYCAYRELSLHCNVEEIARSLGMKTSDITKAISAFSEVQTGYRKPDMQKSPADFIPEFCGKMGLSDETIRYVHQFAVEIIEKEPALLERSPQNVAAGILRYYMVLRGIQISSQDYCLIVGRSEAIIKSSYTEIVNIDARR